MNKTVFPLLIAGLLTACAQPYPGADAKSEPAASPSTIPAATAISIDPALSPEQAERIRASLGEHIPELQISAIRNSPIEGVYEVQYGMEFIYVSADGRYLISGELFEIPTKTRLTEERRRVARADIVKHIDPATLIDFAPETPAAYTVTVFTDIDCGYCRMLHRQIEQYEKAGIEIRYAFFPRSGPGTDSFFKAEQVWCSADRKSALTEAKAGAKLDGPRDCENPVAQHYQLAMDLGLEGTPAIIMPDGSVIPGYQPPAQLRAALDALAGVTSAPADATPAS